MTARAAQLAETLVAWTLILLLWAAGAALLWLVAFGVVVLLAHVL